MAGFIILTRMDHAHGDEFLVKCVKFFAAHPDRESCTVSPDDVDVVQWIIRRGHEVEDIAPHVKDGWRDNECASR